MAAKKAKPLKTKASNSSALALDLTKEQHSFLAFAAQLDNKPVAAFILEAAHQAAEQVMTDQRRFLLNAKQWSLFNKALEAPAKVLPHLKEIIPEKAAQKGKKKGKPMQPRHLKKKHDLSQFDCGNQSLNVWLKKSGLESDAGGSTFTHVLCDGSNVIAYYSFAAGSIELADSAKKPAKGKARTAVPILLLNRIAIDKRYHGQGLSAVLARHALWRAYALSKESVPLRCLAVVAANESSHSFYKGLDFQTLANRSLAHVAIGERPQAHLGALGQYNRYFRFPGRMLHRWRYHAQIFIRRQSTKNVLQNKKVPRERRLRRPLIASTGDYLVISDRQFLCDQ